MASDDRTAQAPYRVEVDKAGCEHCEAGRTWTVIGPDGVALGISWEHEEVAEEHAEALNQGYEAGKAAALEAAGTARADDRLRHLQGEVRVLLNALDAQEQLAKGFTGMGVNILGEHAARIPSQRRRLRRMLVDMAPERREAAGEEMTR